MKKLWHENRSFIVFLFLMFCFRSAIADWNTVPTGSMNPTIIEGDRLGINKLAYDLRIPFTQISLLKIADPMRGDIAIFESEVAGTRLVKRVIGIPGDTVAMRDNRLYINGQVIDYSMSENELFEHLPGNTHSIKLNSHASHLASFDPITIPHDQYLMLGDNRDNSADSRVIGLVPRNEFIGRSTSVVMSLDYENSYLPRTERFFHEIN